MPIHDFISDESRRHLLRIDDSLTAPDFVKEAAVDAEAVEPLPRWQFALPDQRRFPIDNPGHVWLSYAYVKSAGIQDAALVERLKTAAASFKIEDSLKAIDEAFAPKTIKEASAPRFAVTVDFGPGDEKAEDPMVKAGGTRGFYPINDRLQVEESGRQLQNDCFRIPEELYLDGCRSLVKAASEHNGTRLPSLVQFYGEDHLPDLPRLQALAVKSQEMTKDASYADLLKRVEVAFDAFDVPALQKCADAWLAKDREHFGPQNLLKMETVLSAFQTGPLVRSVEETLAKWASVGGAMLPKVEIAAIDDDTLAARFTKAAADKLRPIVKAAQEKSQEVQGLINDLDVSLQKDLARLVLHGA